ncbi:MAG: VCBS repeat-containing protein [Akkermansiaceae bacterium]
MNPVARGRLFPQFALCFLTCAFPASAAEDTPLFASLPAEITGVDFINPIEDSHPLDHLYASGFAAGSVTVADFNGDQKPDLFFTGGAVPNALYLQNPGKKLSFQKVSCGVESPQNWGAGAAAIDIDLDGDLDLYVCNYDRPNELFLNQGVDSDGKLNFIEDASSFGLDLSSASLMPNFADFDLDGDLDLFLLTSQFILENGRPHYVPARMSGDMIIVDKKWDRYFEGTIHHDGSRKLDLCGAPDRLFRNDGKKGFIDITSESGITGRTFGLSSAWLDVDHDDYPDIYVASDFETPDKIWRNNGDGTFRDIAAEALPYCSWSSMGLDLADFDGNGLLDILVADMGGSTHYKSKIGMGVLSDHRRHLLTYGTPHQTMRNCLLLDTGTGRFREAAYLAGLAKTDWTWSCKAGDFDNDGRVDVFFTNGVARNFAYSDLTYGIEESMGTSEWDHYKHLPPERETNRAFRNEGDLKFKNVSKNWGLDHLGMSFGAAKADLDLDGDLDLITCNLAEPVAILENRQSENHGLILKLIGSEKNPQAIGARVQVTSEKGHVQIRQIHPSAGYLSFDSTHLHFGLGQKKSASQITVTWPDGTEQEFGPLEAGKLHPLEKGESSKANSNPTTPLFTQIDAGPKFTHKENSFDDFDDFLRQPLLPIRLSRTGPGMAWADFDEDGDNDVYFGGARGQAGELHLNQGEGIFKKLEGPWSEDDRAEDTGVLWFDADLDGDLDLFVASGGAESFNGSETYQDRLYLNQGDGKFLRSDYDSLPAHERASSTVSAADFDRDGDLDLFIGTRLDPGRYPRTPKSRLLRNDSMKGQARFTEITNSVSETLKQPGLVTSSCWSDLDGNGWPDLILGIDYGPVRVFLNHKGELSDSTKECGLQSRSGWWNSVTTADLDSDGRLDLITGNTGLNTKYGTLSPKNTVEIYYGDMDGSGVPRIVEAKYSKERPEPLPVRGKG